MSTLPPDPLASIARLPVALTRMNAFEGEELAAYEELLRRFRRVVGVRPGLGLVQEVAMERLAHRLLRLKQLDATGRTDPVDYDRSERQLGEWCKLLLAEAPRAHVEAEALTTGLLMDSLNEVLGSALEALDEAVSTGRIEWEVAQRIRRQVYGSLAERLDEVGA